MGRYGLVQREEVRVVVAEVDGQAVDLSAVDSRLTGLDFVFVPEQRERIAGLEQDAPPLDWDPERFRWLPPFPAPSKILCVGRNYAEHAQETGSGVPEEPLVFSKLATALSAHDASIPLPLESSQVDYEAELVVVVGKSGRRISREHALEHVAGYTCGQDVTARDWQKSKPGGQWLLGKSFDGFAPIGPWFVTADEIPNPHELRIQLQLNDLTMQDSNTCHFIYPVDCLIAYISQVCTLRPGDLLFTGTPAGVGVARKPPVFLQPGDVTTISIEGIGQLRNQFA